MLAGCANSCFDATRSENAPSLWHRASVTHDLTPLMPGLTVLPGEAMLFEEVSRSTHFKSRCFFDVSDTAPRSLRYDALGVISRKLAVPLLRMKRTFLQNCALAVAPCRFSDLCVGGLAPWPAQCTVRLAPNFCGRHSSMAFRCKCPVPNFHTQGQ